MDDDEVEVTEQKSYPDEDDAKKREEAIQQLTQQGQQAQQAAMMGDPQAQQAVQQIAQRIQIPGQLIIGHRQPFQSSQTT
jgi:N-acetylmuramic acid 6-phosphate (MurNAc-6-P) etherase